MGGQRGKSRKFDSSKLDAEDAKIVEETTNTSKKEKAPASKKTEPKKEEPKKEEKKPASKKEEPKKTEASTESTTKKPAPEKKTEPVKPKVEEETSDNDFDTTVETEDTSGVQTEKIDIGDPSSFNFQQPEDVTNSQLNIPVSNATKNEGKTLKNEDSFTMENHQSQHNNFNQDNNTGPQTNPGGGGSNNPPPNDFGGGFDNVVDDGMPGGGGGEHRFDEYGSTGGDMPPNPGVAGMELPPDFVEWAAEKKAEWIVDMRDLIVSGFMSRNAQISPLYLRHQGVKYEVPKHILGAILKDVEQYNNHVEDSVQLSKTHKKVLKYLYAAVLKEHNKFSEKMSPTNMLIITEIGFMAQQFAKMQEAKKFGMEMMAHHKDLFENYYNSQHPPKENQTGENNDSTTEAKL